MPLIPSLSLFNPTRLLAVLLAVLTLVWAGAASAEEAYDSAVELAEQVQVDQFSQLDKGFDDPLDCPTVVSPFRLPATLGVPSLYASAPLPPHSFLPKPTAPPPRAA